jgi:hypothetical protein
VSDVVQETARVSRVLVDEPLDDGVVAASHLAKCAYFDEIHVEAFPMGGRRDAYSVFDTGPR